MNNLDFLKRNLEYNNNYYETIFYKKDVCAHPNDYFELYKAIKKEKFWENFWKKEIKAFVGSSLIYVFLQDLVLSAALLGVFSFITQLDNYLERKYEIDENIKKINDIISNWTIEDIINEIKRIEELSLDYQLKIDELDKENNLILRREME